MLLWLCVTFLALAPPAFAQEAPEAAGSTLAVDKGQYTLLNPTPRVLLREMVTDRPDKTESPYTVDAGHFQVEMDLVTVAWDRDTSDGGYRRTTALAVAPINLKVGLLNSMDFQLIVETWNQVKI